ncbi:MAG: HDIG domain-containing protein [Candidatus Thermoplasmatota archaeon]|nr:HDIG domain-containing protein [Candidatus Thermoplasmatota archaeon]
MSYIPSPDKCIDLLKIAGCSKEVINHCIAVRDMAVKIAKKADANIELVEAGSLLHDIGRSKTHGIHHAIEGVKIVKKLNLDESIIRIIERHIGAGLLSEDAKKLGLPMKDYMPVSLEEKIVCHADNLVNGSKRPPVEIEVEKALTKGHKDYAIRLVNLHKELSEICGIDLNKI